MSIKQNLDIDSAENTCQNSPDGNLKFFPRQSRWNLLFLLGQARFSARSMPRTRSCYKTSENRNLKPWIRIQPTLA